MQSDSLTEPRLVISIDFGSYASGFALQWRSDYETRKQDIYCNTWPTGHFVAYKTVTCLLLRPDKKFDAFGEEAETKYAELASGDHKGENHEDWYLFRHFKMALYKHSELSERTLLKDVNGKPLSVLEVISHAIKYMKDEAIEYIKDSGLAYLDDYTKWVLTVPAIWDNTAKQVMRSCAEKAGIRGSHLSIALEPECAGLYCKQIPCDQLSVMNQGAPKYIGDPGSTFMVVDIGGGTVDITTLRVNDDGTVKQVYKSTGGPYGGTNVNDGFFQLLERAIGKDNWSEFVKNNRDPELQVRRAFELEKRQVSHRTKGKTNFNVIIPAALMEFLKGSKDSNIQHLLGSGNDFLKIQKGRFVLPIEKITAMFDEAIKGMIKHIDDIITESHVSGVSIDSMIVVGGFAGSGYVISRLRSELEKCEISVLRPQDTELAVLKGAVLYGHNEKIVTARVMQHTYGVGMVMEFDGKRNNPDKRFTDEKGKAWATDVFRKHVTVNQEVKTGEWMAVKDYYPDYETQTKATVYVYSSDSADPGHTTDDGCQYVGKFDIRFASKKAEIEIAMYFSGTEIVVRARDKKSGSLTYQVLNAD